jgi:hypothetical protein
MALIGSGVELEDEAPPRIKREMVKQEAALTAKEEAEEKLTEVRIKKEAGHDEESVGDKEEEKRMDSVEIKKEED